MTDFYIPPQGLFFRLLCQYSGRVLVSRTHVEPQVFHHPQADQFDDQFFQLIHGTGKRAGCYAFKSKVTNKVLFSRRSSDPRIGHIDGNGVYDDNWFKFELGTGNHASHFRLRNCSSDTVLVSRTHASPQVFNHPASERFDDQYFSFLFEDMKIDRVVYHVDQGKILSSTPLVIASQTLTNKSDIQQSMEFNVDKSTTHTADFEYTLGFAIKIGCSGEIGLPFVAEGKIDVEVTNEHTFKWGWSTSTSVTYAAKLPVVAPPQSTARAVSSITKCILNIPCTVHSKSVSTGVKVQTQAIYNGVTSWDLRHTVTIDPSRSNFLDRYQDFKRNPMFKPTGFNPRPYEYLM